MQRDVQCVCSSAAATERKPWLHGMQIKSGDRHEVSALSHGVWFTLLVRLQPCLTSCTSPTSAQSCCCCACCCAAGAGSFGRVYRARWGGRDVAVKVIEHNSDASSAVESECRVPQRKSHSIGNQCWLMAREPWQAAVSDADWWHYAHSSSEERHLHFLGSHSTRRRQARGSPQLLMHVRSVHFDINGSERFFNCTCTPTEAVA